MPRQSAGAEMKCVRVVLKTSLVKATADTRPGTLPPCAGADCFKRNSSRLLRHSNAYLHSLLQPLAVDTAHAVHTQHSLSHTTHAHLPQAAPPPQISTLGSTMLPFPAIAPSHLPHPLTPLSSPTHVPLPASNGSFHCITTTLSFANTLALRLAFALQSLLSDTHHLLHHRSSVPAFRSMLNRLLSLPPYDQSNNNLTPGVPSPPFCCV